jgi:hypothetical protein
VWASNNINTCGISIGGLLLPLKLHGNADNGLKTSHPAGTDATLLQLLLKLRTGATTVFIFYRGNIRPLRGPCYNYLATIAKAMLVEVRSRCACESTGDVAGTHLRFCQI